MTAPNVWTWLRNTANIRTIVDIGASNGEYAAWLDTTFRPAALHAFEPQPGHAAALAALTERLPHVTVHPVALAEQAGTVPFHLNAIPGASSILPITPTTSSAWPKTATSIETTVQAVRLDDALDADALERNILIKIDVQGYEDRVIEGGRRLFRASEVVLIEQSFVALYEGQPLFGDVHRLLEACGLLLAGIQPAGAVHASSHPETGQPLFAHCFYRRA